MEYVAKVGSFSLPSVQHPKSRTTFGVLHARERKRAHLCDYGVCGEGETSGIPEKISSGALLWKSTRVKSETHVPRSHIFLLPCGQGDGVSLFQKSCSSRSCSKKCAGYRAQYLQSGRFRVFSRHHDR